MTSTAEPVKIAGYRIEGVLGAGGMSRVYAARQISVDRKVALKIFELGGDGGSQAAARLRREAHLLAKLDHESIVRCIDFGESEGFFYLALELVDGESLKQRLDRGGPLVGKDAARIASTVGLALQYAHGKGIVHRDVKPGNILLARDGRVKLSDFGLARTPEDAEITQPGTALGTPQYLSPEQARSPRRAGPQSDVYSLGATLYHMLTGEPPHQGETLAEVITAILFEPVTPPERLVEGIDPALSRIIARAMAKDRSRRYRNMLELNADLSRWLAGQADSTAGISWDDAGSGKRRWFRLSRPLALLALGAGVVAVLGGVAAWHSLRPVGPPAVPLVRPAPVDLAELRSGTMTPLAAWNRVEQLPETDPRREALRAELLRELGNRADAVARSARSGVRSELLAGRFPEALAKFDAAVESAAAGVLGGALDVAPEPLTSSIRAAAASQRGELEQLITRIEDRADVACENALLARRDEIDSAVHDDRIDRADELIAKLEAAATQQPIALFRDAVRTDLPDSQNAAPPGDWQASQEREWLAAASEARSRVASRSSAIAAAAIAAIDDFSIAESDPTPLKDVEAELRKLVTKELGPTAAAIRTRWTAVQRRLDERIAEIGSARSQYLAARRAEHDAEVASSLFDVLAKGDWAQARQLAGKETSPSTVDPLLATLLLAIPAFETAERAVLASFEGSRGKRLRIRTRSLELDGLFDSFDPVTRTLEFTQPSYKVAIDDLATDEYERRAGDAATPLLRTMLRLFRGDVDGARAAIAGQDSEPWFRGANTALADLEATRDGKAKGDAVAAEELLAKVDAATKDPERAAEAAEAAATLISSASYNRLPAVKPRLAQLKHVRDVGRAAADRAKKRESVVAASRAKVEFEADGRVHWSYDFERPAEAEDLTLPGKEWKVAGGRLSSLSALDSVAPGGRIDLFRNRTGVSRRLQVIAERSLAVEFELVLPLDPAPGLIGIRVGSTCFMIRNLSTGGGQVNAWLGDLDDFRDYFYEPALGETRPKKSGGGGKSYSLERGNRYHVAIESSGGSDAEWSLKIEGGEVYRWRPSGEQRASTFELRTEMPCEIDDLSIRGYVAGVK